MHSVTLSVESVTTHEESELVSMDTVDLCMNSEIRYPWIMFTCTKQTNSVNRHHNFP